MSTVLPNTLMPRPTYPRRISDDNRIERASDTLSPTSTRVDRLPDTLSVTPGAGRSGGLRPHMLPTPPRSPAPQDEVSSYARDVFRAYWKDLLVGVALTAIVSWAIWATVKIRRTDLPMCVFDRTPEL